MWCSIGRSWSSLTAQTRHVVKAIAKRHKHSHVGVVCAPFNRGQRREGVERGPIAIKDTGVLKNLENLGVNIVDYGSVSMEEEKQTPEVPLGPDGERHHSSVLSYNKRLSSSVLSVIQKGGLCLTLGGDHSIAIGTINGHAQANTDHQVVVLWVDAHADLNTGLGSLSGNMHGMPVAHHLRELADAINRLPHQWPTPCMSAKHIVYIGLRDVDVFERKTMEDLGILSYFMEDVDRLGIEEVIKKSLEQLCPSDTRPLHVSFDIDALDPKVAPSTGTPVQAGLTLTEGLNIVEAARKTGYLKAFDLVEVNPALGTTEDVTLTTQSAKAVLMAALTGQNGRTQSCS